MTAGTDSTATPEQAPEPWRAAWTAFVAVTDPGRELSAVAEGDEVDPQWVAAWKAAAQAAIDAAPADPRERPRSRSLASALQRLTKAHQDRGDVLAEMFAHWEYIGTTREDDAKLAGWRKRARLEAAGQ